MFYAYWISRKRIRDAQKFAYIGLHVGGGDRLEFCGGDGGQEGGEDGEVEFCAGPCDERLQVGFGDAAYRVNVRRAAVIFREIAPQRFVNIGGAED